MNKKAISQLVSFVLLVGFAVAMATVIINWSKIQTENIDFKKDYVREQCANVRVEINGVCRTPDGEDIKVLLSNPGYWDIPFATIGRETASIPQSWCLDLEFNSNVSSPGVISTKSYKINGTFLNSSFGDILNQSESLNQYTECKDLQGGQVVEGIETFTILPWLRIDEQTVPCSEKKISITQTDILCQCNASSPTGMDCPN